MRRLLLPLMLCAVYAGGCAQSIASRILVPAQPEDQREYLAEQRRQIGRRVGDRLKGVDYRSADGTRLAALMILPDRSVPARTSPPCSASPSCPSPLREGTRLPSPHQPFLGAAGH